MPKKEFFRALFGVADRLTSEIKNLTGIGIGIPGLVTSNGKVFAEERKFIGLANADIRRIIQKRYGVATSIDNDAKTAALGEFYAGAGKDSNSMFMLTLGTGVGGAYIKNGVIQRGSFDSAYEVWAMILDAEPVLNEKEKNPEWFAGELFFKRQNITPLEASIRARNGDEPAIKLWQKYGAYLGLGISNIVNLIEPERIVISGNITKSYALFSRPMNDYVKKFIRSPLALKHTKISLAKLSQDAGAVGAAYLALTKKQNSDN